jgi:hypothetical protein
MTTLTLVGARKRLLVHWYAGSLFAVLTLFGQTLGGRHGDAVDRVWSWLVSAVLPTLSLITAVVGAEALLARRQETAVDRFFYRVTVLLTWVYLGAVAIILWIPWQSTSFLQRAGFFTAALQGIVAGAFGVFFTRSSAPAAQPAPWRPDS